MQYLDGASARVLYGLFALALMAVGGVWAEQGSIAEARRWGPEDQGYPLLLPYHLNAFKAEPEGLRISKGHGRIEALPLSRPVPIANETRQAIFTATSSVLVFDTKWKPGLCFVGAVALIPAGPPQNIKAGKIQFTARMETLSGTVLSTASTDCLSSDGKVEAAAWIGLKTAGEAKAGPPLEGVRLVLETKSFSASGQPLRATPEQIAPLGVLACWGDPRLVRPVEDDPSPAVFLLTFDTLRADRINDPPRYGAEGKRGMPTFSALARRGYLFEHCYSPTSWTLPAYQALLSGLHPAQLGYGRENTRDSNEENFAKLRYGRAAAIPAFLRKERHFHCVAATGGGMLEPWQNNFLKGFSYYWANPTLKVTLDAEGLARTEAYGNALRFRAQLQVPRSGPVFGFYHTYEPHTPYQDTRFVRGLAAGRIKPPFGEGTYLYGDVRALHADYSADEKAYVEALYDGDVGASDDVLKMLLADIEQAGLLKRSWIIVTSDHGEEFWEHGGMSHGHSLYDELLRVPLLIVPPGGLKQGVRVKQRVSLLDLFPTLCALVEAQAPPDLLGRSLKPLLDADPVGRENLTLPEEPGLFVACGVYHGPSRWALRRGPWKYIRSTDVGRWAQDEKNRAMFRLEPEELYDLSSDPGEQRNLAKAEAHRGTLEKLSKALDVIVESALTPLPLSMTDKDVRPAPADPAVLEKLKKLGY